MAKARKEPEQQAPEIPDIKRQRPEVPVRCGQCLFLSRYATYSQPCEKFGTVPSSIPCARFTADPSQLGDAREAWDVMRVVTNSDHATLLASVLLLGSRRARRLGFRIGQMVYFRVLGGEYLCNYASAIVTGGHGANVVLMGAQGFVAVMKSDLLMGRKDWETLRDSLIKRNRINDPVGGLRRIPVRGKTRLVSYEPPEMSSRGGKKRRGPRSTFSGKKSTRKGAITLSGGDVR